MGSFGLVWKAEVIDNSCHQGEQVAIKIIDLEQIKDSSIDGIEREIAIMSKC
jgi:serine/threonine protein kinase